MELPPMMVAETPDAPPWLYAQLNGMEYLSRCSATITRSYVENWERALQRLWTMVPDSLLPRRDFAAFTILYSQKLAQSTSPELLQALKQSAASAGRPAGAFGGYGDLFFRFAPNLRLEDRDVYATFTYIDEMNFDAGGMRIAPSFLQFMLERRVPALPEWFIVGMVEVYRTSVQASSQNVLAPVFWIDRVQTKELSLDPDYPRALLPGNELFAPDVLHGKVNGNSRRVDTASAQAALFVRWALETGPTTREALWKFAARTAEEPPTEELFTACFGFGYSELRDRLSDFLPQAVIDNGRFEVGKSRVPRVAVRPATPREIARLRGEWERLAATYVRQKSPELHGRYLDQARKTLHRTFDTGDRDPRLLASLGFCELEAGDVVGARFFLEPAAAAGITRPRVHHELARLRYAELWREGTTQTASPGELAPVLARLRVALQQRPLLPEAVALFADVLARSETPPSAADMARLETGAQAFARQTDISLPLAIALARHGRKELAVKLATIGADYGRDAATRNRFVQLRAALETKVTP